MFPVGGNKNIDYIYVGISVFIRMMDNRACNGVKYLALGQCRYLHVFQVVFSTNERLEACQQDWGRPGIPVGIDKLPARWLDPVSVLLRLDRATGSVMRKQIVFGVVFLPVNVKPAECDTAVAHRIPLYATPLLLRIDKYSADMEIYAVIFHIKILLEIQFTPKSMVIALFRWLVIGSCRIPIISACFRSCHARAG